MISSLSLLTISLLLAVAPVRSQDSETSSIVCTEEGRVVLVDGELEYGSLPPSDPQEREEYSPQGLAGWYNMARGFVNVVQPENLPYDVIEATIEDNDLPCSVRGEDNCQGGDADVQTTLEDFGEWWAPLIAVTVLGGVMGITFGVVGAVFWCCRCCGQCGGGRSKRDPQDKCMFVITIILLLVTLLLFVGVVLSFYSNEQSFDTIESLQETVNEIIGTGVDYMNTFLSDGDTLFCQFAQVTDIALGETRRLNDSLNELIDEVGTGVDAVLQELGALSTGINQTSDILMNVSTTTMTLQSQSAALNTTLGGIATDVDALVVACMANPAVSSECSNIPSATTFQLGADYANLPDVTQELSDVQESLDGIDISNSVEEGNAEFERVTAGIQSEINSNLGGLEDTSNSSGVLGALTDANNTLFETRDEVVSNITRVIQNDFNSDDCPSLGDVFGGEAEDIEVDVGFIRECYFNQIFEQIKEYDVYRYAFGIIICSLALLTVILTIVGMALGVLGWRRDRSPDSRTRASHCGGIILLINVGLTFLFGFVLLILASLAFFFGSNMQKICQAIEAPEYEVFTRVIDNTELWRGSLLGETVLQGRGNLSISGALLACDRDEALYSAFNLSSLFDVRMEILNTTETFGDLEQEVNQTIDSFNYTSDSFLDANTRGALNNFTDASVENINTTAFTETLANDVLSFNLPETISTLQQISIAFMTAGETDLATDTDSIITQLQDVQNNQIPAINMSVQLLESQVNDLSTHIDTVVVSTNDAVAVVDDLVRNLTGAEFRERIRSIAITALDNLEYYIEDFINHTAAAVEMDVGQCRPLYIIYLNAYDLACNEAVDGLNGYWWSLGFCALCFIPLIVLAVLASTHYLRQRKGDDEDAYPDYPLKAR